MLCFPELLCLCSMLVACCLSQEVGYPMHFRIDGPDFSRQPHGPRGREQNTFATGIAIVIAFWGHFSWGGGVQNGIFRTSPCTLGVSELCRGSGRLQSWYFFGGITFINMRVGSLHDKRGNPVDLPMVGADCCEFLPPSSSICSTRGACCKSVS